MCQQVEERLAFYETGVATKTNEEVMREAVAEYNDSIKSLKQKKKKKKKNKQQATEQEDGVEILNGSEEMEITTPKKGLKKKKSHQSILEEENLQPKDIDSPTPSKCKPRKQKKTLTS